MSAPENNGLSLTLPPALIEHIVGEITRSLAEQLPTQREPYLNVEQAAEYLATKPKRIYELKEAGKVPCLWDGKRLLFRREDLDEYVAGP